MFNLRSVMKLLVCRLKVEQHRYVTQHARSDPVDWATVSDASKMHAWQIHSYGQLSELGLREARVPALRAPDELLVRVLAASVNPIDVAMVGGYGSKVLNTLRSLDGVGAKGGVEFPLTVGRDFCGVVERAGSDAVHRLPPGTRVWGVVPPHWPGSHAQYVVTKDRWAGVAPSTLSDLEAGGALYAALTARAGLVVGSLGGGRAGEAQGRRVLLLGLGGVGAAALQLLTHAGAEVVVGCARDLCERAGALGACAVLPRDDPNYDHELVANGPYDVVLDCAGLGGEEAARRPWRYRRYVTFTTPLLRRTDALGVCAGAAGSLADWLAQAARAAALRTTPGADRDLCVPSHVRWAYFMPSADGIETLARMARSRKFRVAVERAWPWPEAADAFGRAARQHLRGKLLLDFTTTTTTTAAL